MIKLFQRLAMFAVVSVAVGAVALTSCTKDDEVINNGNYYLLKNQEVENDDTIGTRDVYFWDPLTKEYSIKGFNWTLQCVN